MSLEVLNSVLRRLADDEEFVDQFVADPQAALAAYELTDDERQALISGNLEQLEQLGAAPDLIEEMRRGLNDDRCPQYRR
jgi:hypothetical protein